MDIRHLLGIGHISYCVERRRMRSSLSDDAHLIIIDHFNGAGTSLRYFAFHVTLDELNWSVHVTDENASLFLVNVPLCQIGNSIAEQTR